MIGCWVNGTRDYSQANCPTREFTCGCCRCGRGFIIIPVADRSFGSMPVSGVDLVARLYQKWGGVRLSKNKNKARWQITTNPAHAHRAHTAQQRIPRSPLRTHVCSRCRRHVVDSRRVGRGLNAVVQYCLDQKRASPPYVLEYVRTWCGACTCGTGM